jgi:endonuclease YncB( thermonuclease family)
MRAWLSVLVLAVGLVATAKDRPWPERPVSGWSTDATITRVIDGDTVVVEVRRELHIRLLGCWAPESRSTDPREKTRGLAAKANMQKLCPEGQAVRLLIPPGKHKEDISDVFTMGRAMAYVWRDGDDRTLSQQQVDGGFAVRDDPNGRHDEPDLE